MKNKAKNSIELTFPKFATVNDYCQFAAIADNIEELTGKKIKYIEITGLIVLEVTELIKLGIVENNFDDMPNHVGLFYIGKQPTKEEIKLNVKKWVDEIKEEWL